MLVGHTAFALCKVTRTQVASTEYCLALYPFFMVDQPVNLRRVPVSGSFIQADLTGGVLGVKGMCLKERYK